ncbi:uncharacterized protein [Panulirus ornatus]
MDSELLALQWMEHSRIFSQAIGSLRGKAAYTDATLACEGRFFPVHKFVLSTCSEYFNAIFDWTPCVNPVVVLNNVACKELEALLDFMYIGEVNVREAQIPDVMHAAECLRIRGLAMVDDDGVKTQISARSPSDLDGPLKKKRRPDVQRSVATTSQMQLPPPTHPAPHLNSHTPRLPPPTVVATTSAHHLSPEPNFSSTVDNTDHPHHSQLPKPHHHHIQQQQTFPIQSSSTVNLPHPQPSHTPQPSLTTQHSQLGMNQNLQIKTSPSHLSVSQHVSPTDLSTHGQTQEINIPPALTPIDKVMQEVKVKFENTSKQQVLEAQPEDGSVGIPDLLDSLVDMRPLYDAKGTQGEEFATFHSVEASENLYDFTEEFPETSSSSQSDAQYQRNHTTSSSLVKVERDTIGEAARFKCQCCNRSYQKKESLTRHMHVHTNEPYTCTHCGHISKTYRSHLEHKREHHSRHTQQKKETSAVHKCHVCSFTSNRHDNVKRHMLSHTGEKPHKCPHCDFRAKRSQYLHKHIKNIHKKK